MHVGVAVCHHLLVKNAPQTPASAVKGEPRRAVYPPAVPTCGGRAVEGGQERCHRRYKPEGEIKEIRDTLKR